MVAAAPGTAAYHPATGVQIRYRDRMARGRVKVERTQKMQDWQGEYLRIHELHMGSS